MSGHTRFVLFLVWINPLGDASRLGASALARLGTRAYRAAMLVMLGCLAACSSLQHTEHQVWRFPGATEFEAFATAPLLLVGEQHDAPEHHRIQSDLVNFLIGRDRLGALVLEMAEQGRSTQGLPASATQSEVKTALAWADAGWPWADYQGAIMAAVRAGVPVLGANLGRADLRAAMGNTALDQRLSEPARQVQDDRMRSGHCDMLPPSQLRPMTRVQIARDLAMAQTMTQALTQVRAHQSVLLLAGHGHVDTAVGVPVHLVHNNSGAAHGFRVLRLQAGVQQPEEINQKLATSTDLVWVTPALPPTDYCASLRQAR